MQTLSSTISNLFSAATYVFDNFYNFFEPYFDIAKGASQLLGMFQ